MIDEELSEGASPDGETGSREPSPKGLGPTGFDPAREAGLLSSTQKAIIAAAATENDYRQAWLLWRRAGFPGFANGREVVRLIKPTGLFENRMGGQQILVWKLNDRGKAVAAAIAMDARSVETAGLHPKDDSTGPQDIAQPPSGDPQ